MELGKTRPSAAALAWFAQRLAVDRVALEGDGGPAAAGGSRAVRDTHAPRLRSKGTGTPRRSPSFRRLGERFVPAMPGWASATCWPRMGPPGPGRDGRGDRDSVRRTRTGRGAGPPRGGGHRRCTAWASSATRWGAWRPPPALLDEALRRLREPRPRSVGRAARPDLQRPRQDPAPAKGFHRCRRGHQPGARARSGAQ